MEMKAVSNRLPATFHPSHTSHCLAPGEQPRPLPFRRGPPCSAGQPSFCSSRLGSPPNERSTPPWTQAQSPVSSRFSRRPTRPFVTSPDRRSVTPGASPGSRGCCRPPCRCRCPPRCRCRWRCAWVSGCPTSGCTCATAPPGTAGTRPSLGRSARCYATTTAVCGTSRRGCSAGRARRRAMMRSSRCSRTPARGRARQGRSVSASWTTGAHSARCRTRSGTGTQLFGRWRRAVWGRSRTRAHLARWRTPWRTTPFPCGGPRRGPWVRCRAPRRLSP